MMKMIPYGLTDFVRVRTESYYYVDTTSFPVNFKSLLFSVITML